MFATPGARSTTGRLVITEAPIDALSLAVAGVPAIALGGTSWPDWLPSACALRPVVLALDADKAGDDGCTRLTGALQAYGATIERWRPSGGKDWNDLLTSLGADRLRAELMRGDAEAESARLRAAWLVLVRQADELGRGAAILERDGVTDRADALADQARALLERGQPLYDQWVEVRTMLGRPWRDEARALIADSLAR